MSQTYYRFTRPDGTTVLVSDADAIPKARRADAEAVEIEFVEGAPQSHALEAARDSLEQLPVNGLTLVVIGVVGLAGVGLAGVSARKSSLLTRFFLFTAGGALVASLYFGWVQRQAGFTDGIVGSPTEILDRAKQVAGEAQQRNREIRDSLNQLKRESQRRRRESEDRD